MPLAADRIDAVFGEFAASTRALSEEDRVLALQPTPVTDEVKTAWSIRATTSGKTTGFRTWPEGTPPKTCS